MFQARCYLALRNGRFLFFFFFFCVCVLLQTRLIGNEPSTILDSTVLFSQRLAFVEARQMPLQWLGILLRREEVSNGCNPARAQSVCINAVQTRGRCIRELSTLRLTPDDARDARYETLFQTPTAAGTTTSLSQS